MKAQHAVLATEPVAPVVAHAGVFGRAVFGVDESLIGLQAEVAIAKVEFFALRFLILPTNMQPPCSQPSRPTDKVFRRACGFSTLKPVNIFCTTSALPSPSVSSA